MEEFRQQDSGYSSAFHAIDVQSDSSTEAMIDQNFEDEGIVPQSEGGCAIGELTIGLGFVALFGGKLRSSCGSLWNAMRS